MSTLAFDRSQWTCRRCGTPRTTSSTRPSANSSITLLEQVEVTVDKASEHVTVRLHWSGGITEDHVSNRPVQD